MMLLQKQDNLKNLRDIYEDFCKTHPELAGKLRDYTTYRKVVLELNIAAQDEILEKHILPLGHRMGSIALCKYKRNFKLTKSGKPKLPINWGMTNALWAKDPGAKELKARIYFTDPFYVGIVWKRTLCSLQGKVLYAFDSSRTNGQLSKTGLKNKLVAKLKEEPLFMGSIKLAVNKYKKPTQ